MQFLDLAQCIGTDGRAKSQAHVLGEAQRGNDTQVALELEEPLRCDSVQVQRGHPDSVFLQRAVSPKESIAFVEPGQGIGLAVEAGEGEFRLARPAMDAEETVTESAAATAAPAATAAAGTLGLWATRQSSFWESVSGASSPGPTMVGDASEPGSHTKLIWLGRRKTRSGE
jgi:hypothetical protein